MEEKLKENKKEKRKARKALVLLLGKLRKKCGSFKDAQEWLTFIKHHVDPILSEFKESIPTDSLHALEKANHLTHQTKDAVNQACNNLQWNVEKVIKLLPAGSPLVPLMIAGVALTGGVFAAAALYLNAKTTTIIIRNNGCDTIIPVTYIPIKIPGLSLFTTPIPNGGTGTIKLLPIPITVDASQKASISLGVGGVTIPVPGGEDISDAASSITFDGEELLGEKTTLNLAKRPSHEVIITCR